MRARAVRKNFQFCYATELQETPLSILMTCHYEANLQPVEFLRSFLRLHLAGKPVLSLRIVGFFLRLWNTECA